MYNLTHCLLNSFLSFCCLFINILVAGKVLKRKTHKLEGNNLSVEGYSDNMDKFPVNPCRYIRDTLITLSIKVSWEDTTATVTKDGLELLFVNQERSGGGVMKAYRFEADDCCAFITFENVQRTCVLIQLLKMTLIRD